MVELTPYSMGQDNEQSPPESVMPEFLDKEQASLLLRAHRRAIMKLASSGKPLPASTLKQVLAVASGGDANEPHWAKNQVELANILGVNRRTISRYLKVEGNPGARADGRYDVVLWRKYLADFGAIEEDDGDSIALKHRLLAAQIEKIENHNAVIRRDFIPVTDAERWGAELGMAIRKVVTQLHLLAPSLVGLTLVETETRLKEAEDQVLTQLAGLKDDMEEWKRATEA